MSIFYITNSISIDYLRIFLIKFYQKLLYQIRLYLKIGVTRFALKSIQAYLFPRSDSNYLKNKTRICKSRSRYGDHRKPDFITNIADTALEKAIRKILQLLHSLHRWIAARFLIFLSLYRTIRIYYARDKTSTRRPGENRALASCARRVDARSRRRDAHEVHDEKTASSRSTLRTVRETGTTIDAIAAATSACANNNRPRILSIYIHTSI